MNDAAVATRLAIPDDAGVLAQLLWDFEAEFDEEAPPVTVLEKRFRRLLGGHHFFAVMAGVPAVGFATVVLRDSAYYEGPVALLEDLYVEPRLRGGGMGSAIMELVMVQARHLGVGSVEVGVDEPDVDALRFYERHGFIHRDPTTGDRAFHIYQELDGADRP